MTWNLIQLILALFLEAAMQLRLCSQNMKL